MSASNRLDLEQIQEQLLLNKGTIDGSLLSRYPIQQIKGAYYLSFLARTSNDFDRTELLKKEFIVGHPIAQIISLKVPINKLNQLSNIKGLQYIEIAGKIQNALDKAIVDIRADSVHQGIGLPQGYSGKDVYIGVSHATITHHRCLGSI